MRKSNTKSKSNHFSNPTNTKSDKPEPASRLVRFIFKIDTYWSEIIDDYWTHADSGIKGSILAAAVSLFVVYLQKWQQEDKDQKHEVTAEVNKLKYLDFLVNDTYKMVDEYCANSDQLKKTIEFNPFNRSEYLNYSLRSLDIIVNKINQEDYYLSSIHQLKNNDITDVFLICNSLYITENKTRSFYLQEQTHIQETRSQLIDKLEGLEREIVSYISNNSNRLMEREKSAHSKLKALQKSHNKLKITEQSLNEILYSSGRDFIIPLIDTLRPYEDIENLRKLLYLCYDVKSTFLDFIVITDNLKVTLIRDREKMKQLSGELQKADDSLKKFLKNN